MSNIKTIKLIIRPKMKLAPQKRRLKTCRFQNNETEQVFILDVVFFLVFYLSIIYTKKPDKLNPDL